LFAELEMAAELDAELDQIDDAGTAATTGDRAKAITHVLEWLEGSVHAPSSQASEAVTSLVPALRRTKTQKDFHVSFKQWLATGIYQTASGCLGFDQFLDNFPADIVLGWRNKAAAALVKEQREKADRLSTGLERQWDALASGSADMLLEEESDSDSEDANLAAATAITMEAQSPECSRSLRSPKDIMAVTVREPTPRELALAARLAVKEAAEALERREKYQAGIEASKAAKHAKVGKKDDTDSDSDSDGEVLVTKKMTLATKPSPTSSLAANRSVSAGAFLRSTIPSNSSSGGPASAAATTTERLIASLANSSFDGAACLDGTLGGSSFGNSSYDAMDTALFMLPTASQAVAPLASNSAATPLASDSAAASPSLRLAPQSGPELSVSAMAMRLTMRMAEPPRASKPSPVARLVSAPIRLCSGCSFSGGGGSHEATCRVTRSLPGSSAAFASNSASASCHGSTSVLDDFCCECNTFLGLGATHKGGCTNA
jgi:hypothetical protein